MAVIANSKGDGQTRGTLASYGAGRVAFERGWVKYCDENPDFDPGFLAAEMAHHYAKRKDPAKFLGALAVADKFLTDNHNAESGQQTLVLVNARTRGELEYIEADVIDE